MFKVTNYLDAWEKSSNPLVHFWYRPSWRSHSPLIGTWSTSVEYVVIAN